MKKLLLAFLLIPSFLFSQSDTTRGIHFEQGLSWEQIKQKAKQESKYIFVDCFTTWCAPCKAMDKDIYTNEKVGEYLNEKFISVKVQADTNKSDNEQVKQWYSTAHSIVKEYKVTTFPSYLFFSPSGEIVHKDLGFKKVDDFIALTKNALNADSQYYTLLGNYLRGDKNYTVMTYLINLSTDLGEHKQALMIGQDYSNNYLVNLNDKELYTKKNLEFIAAYIRNPNEKSFGIFYYNADKVDSIMIEKGFAKRVADFAITKAEISPSVISATKGGPQPNWSKMSKAIKRRFNKDYANRNILSAKVRWYYFKKDWLNYNSYAIRQVKKYGSDTVNEMNDRGDFVLNIICWDGIFFHSNRKKQIKTAIEWMTGVVRRNPLNNYYKDTYANLLYKLGKREDAIEIEKTAVNAEHDSSIKKGYVERLGKMQKGESTWVNIEK